MQRRKAHACGGDLGEPGSLGRAGIERGEFFEGGGGGLDVAVNLAGEGGAQRTQVFLSPLEFGLGQGQQRLAVAAPVKTGAQRRDRRSQRWKRPGLEGGLGAPMEVVDPRQPTGEGIAFRDGSQVDRGQACGQAKRAFELSGNQLGQIASDRVGLCLPIGAQRGAAFDEGRGVAAPAVGRQGGQHRLQPPQVTGGERVLHRPLGGLHRREQLQQLGQASP